ncbi:MULTISPECIES: HlyD family type I secretion periplasmic adaptor subunit [Sphingobium]|uniref:Membrane fusion protein (MFP) family protein n=1 Tax=Sphingobium fuliginis (strain ATCC 27551) TaxID=336203 RepID=A0ABQ1EVJ6_SPHSA|nr:MULTISPECIES: HlyD family type I secretion periplasmic adaptor subunit [Sphingobium]AJR25565.1 secretion protein HylD [Sphingobium sp. YBL2]RYL98862.1 HlyD family type I secretion periplasmic adaptor subunit [Sphingobium fuliginis]UXC92098.1 HlyD family type I secretion periplasmic adaptor subunit [Sphingobium sp. RSMS]WDA37672.1 HlyD family type I secretion periplasmic adaptor subunit [Sphingobium sp. YC-XJ3]GFZ88273.1 HlyD family type I secretion periplasmic adaptor subunit [Sphingobium f
MGTIQIRDAAGAVELYYPAGSGAEIIDDRPERDMRAGMIIAALFFVLFLGWAAFARLDAAAYAPGRLTVSGQRQSVQHRDGGVVGAIFVKEGQHVSQGQPLMELASAEVRAQARIFGAQYIELKAQRARLIAEQLGASHVLWPAEFAMLKGREKADAEEAIRLQLTQFNARSSVLAAQTGVLRQQASQVQQTARGYRSQLAASSEQARLIGEELESLRGVAEKGFVSQSRIRALERARADLQGQEGQFSASIARSGAEAGENRLKALEAEKAYKERASSELRDVEFSLNEVLPKYRAARDQLARLQIRAPATGTIVGLNVFTVGGVISAGQKLMDIVPDRAGLVIEARISPEDIDDLKVGQQAQIKFSSLHERDLPIMDGRITRLSADSFQDEKAGVSFYTAEVMVPPKELDRIRSVRGKDFSLKAGMPVQVLVPLRRRTALQYALEPLTQSLWLSFREH